MIDIPKDIEKYLIRDEVVEEKFILKGQTAYASTNRIFIKKGSTIRDISYTHISSIEFKSSPQWKIILAGILVGIAGYFLQQTNSPQQNDTLNLALIFAGIVLLLVGFFWKWQRVELSVVGMSNSVRLEGERDKLDSLFKLVRERRV